MKSEKQNVSMTKWAGHFPYMKSIQRPVLDHLLKDIDKYSSKHWEYILWVTYLFDIVFHISFRLPAQPAVKKIKSNFGICSSFVIAKQWESKAYR